MVTTNSAIADSVTYGANNYNPLPMVVTRADGVYMWDTEGNRYLDCLAAYSAVNQGHRHPRILKAMIEQMGRVTLTSRAFHNDQIGGFLKKVCEVTEMEMTLPMNSGAEAVETAIKAARKWGYQVKKVAEDKAEIIVCSGNFHGRTMGLVSFSTEKQYREGFGPFLPGFRTIEFGNIQDLEKAITPNTVAFLMEPIQGEAGIQIPPSGFLTRARELCTKNRVLLMFDEIQTGLGRTGKMFAYQHEQNAKPDVLILGKALSGGMYPISVMVSSKEVMGVFKPGDHGSTFGGNPLAAAIGQAALDVLVDENLAERSREMGAYLFEKIQAIRSDHVLEVRARGLMVGIEIKKISGSARPFCEKLMKLGVLAKETHGQTIRIAPPLVINREQLDFLVSCLNQVLQT